MGYFDLYSHASWIPCESYGLMHKLLPGDIQEVKSLRCLRQGLTTLYHVAVPARCIIDLRQRIPEVRRYIALLISDVVLKLLYSHEIPCRFSSGRALHDPGAEPQFRTASPLVKQFCVAVWWP